MKKFIKEELFGWKFLEVFWLVLATVIIAGLSVYWGDTTMGIVSATTGVICVVCTGKGKLSAYIFGAINTLLYAIIAFTSVSSQLLKPNGTQSCGCLQKERVRESAKARVKPNIYNLSGEYGIGYASNTGNEFYFDLEDYEKIKIFRWYEEKRDGYISTVSDNQHIKLHQFVSNNVKYLDHENRNKRDNRKSNLRQSDKSRNEMNKSTSSRNKSGVVGVSFSNRNKKWIAQIKKSNDHRAKYFKDKEEAIKQRLFWEKEMFGAFFWAKTFV